MSYENIDPTLEKIIEYSIGISMLICFIFCMYIFLCIPLCCILRCCLAASSDTRRQIYVAPYTRGDGTPVSGYIRRI